jgi:hypothetical protein
MIVEFDKSFNKSIIRLKLNTTLDSLHNFFKVCHIGFADQLNEFGRR